MPGGRPEGMIGDFFFFRVFHERRPARPFAIARIAALDSTVEGAERLGIDAPDCVVTVRGFASAEIRNSQVNAGFRTFIVFPFRDPLLAPGDAEAEGTQEVIPSIT